MEIFQYKYPSLYPECSECPIANIAKERAVGQTKDEGNELTNVEVSCRQDGWRGGLITKLQTGEDEIPVIRMTVYSDYLYGEGSDLSGPGGGSASDEETVDCPHMYDKITAPK